jgi:hypothetical protein
VPKCFWDYLFYDLQSEYRLYQYIGHICVGKAQANLDRLQAWCASEFSSLLAKLSSYYFFFDLAIQVWLFYSPTVKLLRNVLDIFRGGNLVCYTYARLTDWALAEWSSSGWKILEIISDSDSRLKIVLDTVWAVRNSTLIVTCFHPWFLFVFGSKIMSNQQIIFMFTFPCKKFKWQIADYPLVNKIISLSAVFRIQIRIHLDPYSIGRLNTDPHS